MGTQYERSIRSGAGKSGVRGADILLFAETLCAMADEKPGEQVTIEMIDAAAEVAGIHTSPDKKEALLSRLNEQRRGYDAIQANRARTLAMCRMAELFADVNVIVVPSNSDSQLILTNLTGHPAVIMPNGFRGEDAPKPPPVDTGEDDRIGGPGTPVSLTFLARLYNDSALLAFASAHQQETGFHRFHPPGFE